MLRDEDTSHSHGKVLVTQKEDSNTHIDIGTTHTHTPKSRTLGLLGLTGAYGAHGRYLTTTYLNTRQRPRHRRARSAWSLRRVRRPWGRSCSPEELVGRCPGAPWARRAWPGRGVSPPDHRELLGGESSTSGTLETMNEELRRPGTARARNCQAVRAAVWRASGGLHSP